MKEMVGGCCVCSDERGWDENPLVYCDGPSCNVAVHQACYGIVAVPSGPWYCRKCESTERTARVRCELCPSRDGAFKKTDNNSWAHVVCALYIPEVRFHNVTTMEPILISLVPQDRYNKTCYICEERGEKKESKASMGACMQCNKSGCKQYFHVTCAQLLGLLCEEAGNMMDNVKYCGYCQYHYSKLKKTPNVKIIPPFKPIPSGNATDSPTSSPEKNSGKSPVLSCALSEVPSNQNVSLMTMSGMNNSSSGGVENAPKTMPVTSKGSAKKTSGNGKASSVSSGGSSNGSSSNNNSSAMPRIQIQPSNLFSSTGFSSSLSVLNSNGNGSNTPSGSRDKSRSKSRSRSPSTDEPLVIKSEKTSMNNNGKIKSHSGKSNDEDSNPRCEQSPKLNESRGNKLFDSNSGTSNFKSSSFGIKNKDLATVSMKDVLSTALDKPIGSTGSKFDRVGSSAALTGGISDSSSFNNSSSVRIMDKPPPDIVPHVTLTPIPMKSNEEIKSARSKSPGGFPSSFGHSGKHMSEPMETEMATLEKATTPSPGKRMRMPIPPPHPDYDSDTESATEDWPIMEESRSQSNSQSVIQQTEHRSRRDQIPFPGQQTPVRMLTVAQATEMSLWETSGKHLGSKSPTVALERLPLSKEKEELPFGSTTSYSLDYSSRKRGPGRPSASRSYGGSSRDEESRGKGPGGKRGRRGNITSTNTNNYSRHPSTNNGNGGIILDENPGDGKTDDVDGVNGSSGSSRGGRHTGPVRKGPPPSATVSSSQSLQSSPSVSRKPNYDESPTLTMSQLKAQMAVSTSSTPEKSTTLAPHMYGNALNPASSMAQRMVDTLSQEMETIAAAGSAPVDATVAPPPPVVGISFPGKSTSAVVTTGTVVKTNAPPVTSGATVPTKSQPQTLEELLERQWEQGSQFLMEQAQHLDISQLLSCLNQLKADNKALEDHVASLCQRKEQLTAINARLSIPLGNSNSLGLGLGFSGSSTRQETPPLTTIQANKNTGIPPPHPQLHQHIQQETVGHQGRYSSHKFPGYEPGGHYQQQQVHRGTSGNGPPSQMYGYSGQGSGSSHGHGSVNPHHTTTHPHQQPRDSR